MFAALGLAGAATVQKKGTHRSQNHESATEPCLASEFGRLGSGSFCRNRQDALRRKQVFGVTGLHVGFSAAADLRDLNDLKATQLDDLGSLGVGQDIADSGRQPVRRMESVAGGCSESKGRDGDEVGK